MNFRINLMSSERKQSLLDNFTAPGGITYYKEIMSICNLPQDFPVSDIHIHTSCFIDRVQRIDLEALKNIKGSNITFEELLKAHPILDTPEYFKNKNDVTILMRPGFASQYISENITFEYNDEGLHRASKLKGLKRLTKYTFPMMSANLANKNPLKVRIVHVRYEFDAWLFVNDWIEKGFPLYFGISEEQYNKRITQVE